MTHDPFELMLDPWRKSLPRLILKVAVIVGLVILARWGFMTIHDWISTLESGARANAMIWLIGLSIAAYAILIAIPFVPAVEIGIALMVMEGSVMAPFVYGATVIGLFFAFWVGQRVSLNWLHGFFRDMRLVRACHLLERIRTETPADRIAELESRLPRWLAPLATRYRYITIAVLLSVPGNFAIGGGGGIMMIAGISRFFTAPKMFLTLLIAVLPIPLLVFIFGVGIFV